MALALVTGAAVRVGRAIALALAEAGYDLIIHAYQSQPALAELTALVHACGRQVEPMSADLGDPAAVATLAQTIAQQHTALDVLVNSAGLYENTPFETISRRAYARMMAVNLEAPLFLTQALLPLLRAAPQPCVVNITDTAVDRPYAGYAPYMVSKAALAMLTRVLALELGPHVRVNAVAPGTVAFPADFDAAKRQRIVSHVPLGRTGTPEDIGRAVVYLVRDASYVTGHTLVVDGGAALA
jgi:pteridine reductase